MERRTTYPKLIAPKVAGIEARPPDRQSVAGGSCLAIGRPRLRSAAPCTHCRSSSRRKRHDTSTEGASSSSSAKSTHSTRASSAPPLPQSDRSRLALPRPHCSRATHQQRRPTRAHRAPVELRANITGSRCRRIVPRLKRNLFDDRPLFRLTRAPNGGGRHLSASIRKSKPSWLCFRNPILCKSHHSKAHDVAKSHPRNPASQRIAHCRSVKTTVIDPFAEIGRQQHWRGSGRRQSVTAGRERSGLRAAPHRRPAQSRRRGSQSGNPRARCRRPQPPRSNAAA